MKSKEVLRFDSDPVSLALTLTFIRFEKDERVKDWGTLWHLVFDGQDGLQIFESLLEREYPNGGMLGLTEIHHMVDVAFRYLQTEPKCIAVKAEYDKKVNSSFVFFRPYNRVYPCGFCEHADTVREILRDFFKNAADDLTVDYLARFIRSEFEIRSENLTVSQIAKNAEFYLSDLHRLNHKKD